MIRNIKNKLKLFFTFIFVLSLVFTFKPLIDYIDTIQKLNLLHKDNVEVAHYWKNYGEGYLPLKNFNIHFDDFLKYPNANCYQQSYLFTRKAIEKGFLARRVGLWNSSGANDLMVEVRVNNKWYLFVPSAGVYYRFSLGKLLEQPEKATIYQGIPKEISRMYLHEDFFANIYKVDMYQSVNDVELNYAAIAKVASEDFYQIPYSVESSVDENIDSYAAGKDGLPSYIINLSWQKSVSVYRLFIKWYSAKDYGSEYDVILMDKTNKILKKYHIAKKNESLYRYADYSQIPFSSLVNIDHIKIVVYKTNGQPRLLVREIKTF
jgi:hypothetical protein